MLPGMERLKMCIRDSTNPMATIFAWSGALKKRGRLDGLTDLTAFGEALEQACFDTLNAGIMTKDLVSLVEDVYKRQEHLLSPGRHLHTGEDLPHDALRALAGKPRLTGEQ